MGQPKALMNYHGMPQVAFLFELAKKLGIEAFVSCRIEQIAMFQHYPIIADKPALKGHGPISGLLSAFETHASHWFLVGCDYPMLTESTISTLLLEQNLGFDALSYKHPKTGFAEPLIALYRHSAGHKLLQFFNNNNDSLRKFLEVCKTQFLFPANVNELTSVDSPEEYKRILSELAQLH